MENRHFVAFPGGAEPKKYGINTLDGLSFYRLNDYLYIKRTPRAGQGRYDNNGQIAFPNMIYFNRDFVEMEPNSPMTILKPGESYTYIETWTLIPLNPVSE
ncbi:MAG: DUF4380 domain-containing protein [Mediterranea sp.]|nr:DUF4380 domain-containing protein [Mediterranea sp.]